MEAYDFIRQYSKLRSIKRFYMEPTIRHQDLCGHGYSVGSLFYLLCEMSEVVLEVEDLFLVMNHDFIESFTGDLNKVVKNHNEETEKAWDIIEENIVPSHLNSYTEVKIKKELGIDKYSLFKLADMLDAFLYCEEEIFCGNYSMRKVQKGYRESISLWYSSHGDPKFDSVQVLISKITGGRNEFIF